MWLTEYTLGSPDKESFHHNRSSVIPSPLAFSAHVVAFHILALPSSKQGKYYMVKCIPHNMTSEILQGKLKVARVENTEQW